MNGIYFMVFGIPMAYIFINRHKASFRTRSPKLIIVCFLMMMLDCILNTVMMSKPKKLFSKYTFQCDTGIFITVVVFFGLMSIYFTRMWRVYMVFSLYQDYLRDQNKELDILVTNESLDASQDSTGDERNGSNKIFET